MSDEDGGHLEANTQLATWHAAALLHIQELKAIAAREPYSFPNLFQVGWVVIGHRWELFFTIQITPEKMNSVGPLWHSEIGTMNILSLFQLIAIQRALLRWLKEDYWNAFEELFNSAVEQRS